MVWKELGRFLTTDISELLHPRSRARVVNERAPKNAPMVSSRADAVEPTRVRVRQAGESPSTHGTP